MSFTDPDIPKGVFWVYTTNRFHSLDTRQDMGDEFAAKWLPHAKRFLMAGAADCPADFIHPPMVRSLWSKTRIRAAIEDLNAGDAAGAEGAEG